MKPFYTSILALLAAASGALAQTTTATTTPVGYETLSATSGFSYLGLRLHKPTLVAGVISTITSSALTDTTVNFGSLLTGGSSTTYVLEIDNGTGIIQEITGASASGSSISLVQDITGQVSAGAKYQIRKAATLASAFGVANSAGFAPGYSGSSGADILYVPDGSGGFGQYYYDGDNVSWSDATTGLPVTASSIPLVYPDGIVVYANSTVNVVISGEVKKTSTLQAVISNFNYLSSVSPAEATLASSFNGAVASLNLGYSGSSGADIFYIPDGLGGFGQYYYDGDNVSWSDATTGLPVTASSIKLPSGVIFYNAGTAKNLLNSVPVSYASL